MLRCLPEDEDEAAVVLLELQAARARPVAARAARAEPRSKLRGLVGMGRTARLLCAYSLDGGWVLCRWVGWQPGSPVCLWPPSGGQDGAGVGGPATAGPALRRAVQRQGFAVGGDPAVRGMRQDLGHGGGLLLIGERVV